jgi:hypothetical protein
MLTEFYEPWFDSASKIKENQQKISCSKENLLKLCNYGFHLFIVF